MINVLEIEDVYDRIKNDIIRTPAIFSPVLSEMVNGQVYLKLENLQETGSFKARGACNFLRSRKDTVTHVVAASAGNHAQAVAMHANRMGIKATIFMPVGTPKIKIRQTERLFAEVILLGQTYDEAFNAAFRFAKEHNASYVHAFDEKDIILGQATIALEIFEDLGAPDLVIVPVGGAGLISGILSYFKGRKECQTEVIGVESEDFCSMATALDKGISVKSEQHKTIADGIAVSKIGALPLSICAFFCPRIVLVNDVEIQHAMMLLLEKQKIVVEGAGAVGVVPLLFDKGIDLQGKKIVIIISGGNIDINFLSRLTSQELIQSRRLCRLSIVIKDSPGSLASLLNHIANANGNIVEVRHERGFASLRWNEVMVEITIETKDEIHERILVQSLGSAGFPIHGHRFGVLHE